MAKACSRDDLPVTWYSLFRPKEVILTPISATVPGGGFTGGGANSIAKFPDTWVERTQSHIVVILK